MPRVFALVRTRDEQVVDVYKDNVQATHHGADESLEGLECVA